jgi:uncharacterized membrane protein YgcG
MAATKAPPGFHEMVVRDDAKAVASWLDGGGHIDSLFTSINGRKVSTTALIHASLFGRTQIVDMLLARKASVDRPNSFGDTALMAAADGDNATVVRRLLKAGAQTDLRNGGGRSAMEIASRAKHAACVLVIREYEREVAAQSTPAVGKAETDDEPTSAKVLPNPVPDRVAQALKAGNKEMVEAFLEGGWHVNQRFDLPGSFTGFTLLMAVSSFGHAPLVDLLLERKASVNLQNSKCCNALSLAASQGQDAVVKRLLKAGAGVSDHERRMALDICERKVASVRKAAASDAAKHQASLKAAARAREHERKARESARARLEHAERSRLDAVAKLSKLVASAAVANVLKRAAHDAPAAVRARESAARLAAVLAANEANAKAKERARAVEVRRRAQAASSDVSTEGMSEQPRRGRGGAYSVAIAEQHAKAEHKVMAKAEQAEAKRLRRVARKAEAAAEARRAADAAEVAASGDQSVPQQADKVADKEAEVKASRRARVRETAEARAAKARPPPEPPAPSSVSLSVSAPPPSVDGHVSRRDASGLNANATPFDPTEAASSAPHPVSPLVAPPFPPAAAEAASGNSQSSGRGRGRSGGRGGGCGGRGGRGRWRPWNVEAVAPARSDLAAELMEEVMDELMCPLTRELMIDPVRECGSNSPHVCVH